MGADASKPSPAGSLRYGRVFQRPAASTGRTVDSSELWEVTFFRDASFSLRVEASRSRALLWEAAGLGPPPDSPAALETVLRITYFGEPGAVRVVGGASGAPEPDADPFALLLRLHAQQLQRERAAKEGAFTLETLESHFLSLSAGRVEYHRRGSPRLYRVDRATFERVEVSPDAPRESRYDYRWSFDYADGLVDAAEEQGGGPDEPGVRRAPVPKESPTAPDWIASPGTLDMHAELPPRSNALRLSVRRLRIEADGSVRLARDDRSHEVVELRRRVEGDEVVVAEEELAAASDAT